MLTTPKNGVTMSHTVDMKPTPAQTVCVACLWPLYAGQHAPFRQVPSPFGGAEPGVEFFCTHVCHQDALALGERFFMGFKHNPSTAVS